MTSIYKLSTTLLFFISLKITLASHLIGGNLGYEYLGQVGNNYEYKILFTIYVDCGPSSNAPNPFSTEQIGIYAHDIQNSPMGGGDKNRIQLLTVNLISTQLIVPDLPNGCSVGASTCIREGKYEGTFTVPLNFTGYHLYGDICCRNGAIDNITNPVTQGTGFHAYIPPPLVQNSSPVFTDIPIPYLCAGDTTSILNSAYDPDGDMMVFSFVEPLRGFGTQGFYPAPPNPLTWPLDPVVYAPSYSLAQPFGAGGYSSINASTGLTQYMAPNTGNYVVAVEIKEYRNGNLIGVTRRDLQLLVITCPINPPPNLDPQLGSVSTQYTIEEGETLCFDFGFDDPNGDSLTLSTNGIIFDPIFVNPPATVTSPVTGVDTVSTQFCWTTACGQAQALPYQFQVSAEDRGCPPKTTNEVFQITVTEVPPPDTIIGIDVICQFLTETYSTQTLPNTTYDWSVTNGVITQNNGSSVDIQWTGVGTGTVSLSATNQYGCSSAPITKDVTITPAPLAEAGNDTTICFGDTIQLTGTTNASPGFTALWTPTDSITGNTTLTPLVFPSDTITYTLTIDIGGGCFGFDSVKVNVNIPQIDAGSDTTICEGESVQLNGSSSNGTITWSPAATLSDPTVYDPIATPTLSTNYLLELIDPVGCTLIDSVRVNVDAPVSLTISNDTTICFGDCANLLVTGANNNAWETSTSLNDTSIANPTACPSSTETFTVYGSTGACADTAQVTVTVNTLPTIDAGTDPTICFGDTTNLSAVGAIDYSWSPADSLSSSIISNPQAWPSDTTQYVVTGTDINSCSNTDTVTVNVNPLPNVDAGNNTTICTGDSIQLNATGAATYIWSPVTDLSDPTIADPFASPSTPTTYTVTGTDINGCVNVDSITISLHSLPTATISNDTTICIGDTAQLIASGGANYTWSPADSLSSTVISNPLAWPTATTIYQVIISDNNGCLDTNQVTVTVNPLPTIDAGSNTSICNGDSVQLNASGGVSYSWEPLNNIINENSSNPTVWPSLNTNYIVTGIDINNCFSVDSVLVSVLEIPNPNITPNQLICPGDTVTLNVNATGTLVESFIMDFDNPFSYLTTNTDSIGYYYIVVTGTYSAAGNPLQRDAAFYFAANPPVPSVEWKMNGTAPPPQQPSLNYNPLHEYTFYFFGGSPQNITWTDPGPYGDNFGSLNFEIYYLGDVLWSTGDTTYYTTLQPNSTSNVDVAVSNYLGCTGYDTITIDFHVLNNTISNDTTICIGDTAQLIASGGTNYTWSPADSLSSTVISNPLAWPTAHY